MTWLCKVVHAQFSTTHYRLPLRRATRSSEQRLRRQHHANHSPSGGSSRFGQCESYFVWFFFTPFCWLLEQSLSDAWRFSCGSCSQRICQCQARVRGHLRYGGMGPTLVNSPGWALRGPKILNYWPDLELDAEGDSTTADAVADAQVSASSPKAESDQPDEIRCDH